MASKQNGNTIPAPRPPFRRQGSSIGAAPHPMTVALAPVSRIDYSVTKGGARTWIVLLVFLFLCSGLYTIFSSRERSENTHSANLDHRDRGIGGHRISELSSNQRQSIKEGEEESDDEVDSMEVSVEAVESDEEDVEESPLEDQLFADLRRRIEDNFQRVKELVKDHENARSVEEDIELEPPLRRIKRKKNRSINRGDKVDKSPLVLAKHTLVDVDNGSDDDDGDDVDNNNSSDDENDNNNSINNDIGDDGDSANDNNIKAEEVGQERGNVYKTQILDEKREHSHRKEIKDSENGIGDETDAFEGLRYRRRRSHFSRHLTDVVSERECKRKHCPPLYQAEPRRSLLKTKHKAASNIVIRAKNKVDDRDHDQGGDYENNEADDEVVVQLNEKNTEVVSLSRYRSSGRETYKRQAITNRDDHKNRNLLDRADSLVEKVKTKRFKKSKKYDSQ